MKFSWKVTCLRLGCSSTVLSNVAGDPRLNPLQELTVPVTDLSVRLFISERNIVIEPIKLLGCSHNFCLEISFAQIILLVVHCA